MLSFLLRINNRIRGLEKPLRKGMICNRQAHNTACLKQDALKHSKTMAGDKGIHGDNEKKKIGSLFILLVSACLVVFSNQAWKTESAALGKKATLCSRN